MKKFALGFIIGGIICSALTGFAVEYAVTANPFPIRVDGAEKSIEGYNINDSTYFKLPLRRHIERRLQIVPVRAAVGGEPGEHQPQAVEQLRAGPERAADARHAGALPQGKGRGDIQHLVHARLLRLCHAPPGVGGQGFQIAPGALRIQHAQRKRGFPGAGHARDPHDPVQRNIHVDIFQIMHFRPAHLNVRG